MKRLRNVSAGLLVVIGILCWTATGWAGIPEPDAIYYGMATHKGGIEPAIGQAITLVLNATSQQVATYTLGDTPEYENQFVLRVPMDALASIEGQAATFYIGGRLAGTTHIPAKGTLVQLDLDTLSSNDSDNDGMDDSWEMLYFGTLERDGSGDINGNGITDREEYQQGTDPTAAVWFQVGDTFETCVFHPVVLQRALIDAAIDGRNNRIKLQAGPYAGNFSYTALWGEDFDLEIVGGFGDECAYAGTALTVLDGNKNGPVLTLDAATGQTQGSIHVRNLCITNGSADEGGGIDVLTGAGGVTLLNNVITGNTATEHGGGISLRAQGASQTLLVANNTLDGNDGGGIYCNSTQTSPVIMNNIITNNLGGEGIRAEGAAPDSDYNNLWNNENGGYNNPAFQGDHDVSIDPLFTNTGIGDFSLQAASPCVDAGKNAIWLPDLDIQGNGRITDGDGDFTYLVDLGAYELAGDAPPDTCEPYTDEDCDTVADALDQCPGFNDITEVDTDGDGVPDPCDPCPEISGDDDADEDGMPDCWETLHPDPVTGSEDLLPDEDPDGDNFSNLREYLAGTDPNDDTSVPQNQLPGVPKPTSPPNQSKVGTERPALTVTNASDDDMTPPSYEFEVYAAEDMSTPVAASGDVEQGAGGTTSWQVDTDLDDNKAYRWRVRARDDAVNTSAWSNFLIFFVNMANDAPTAPSLKNPQNGAEVATLEPVLTVNNAADQDQDVLTYRFEIDTVSTFDNPETVDVSQGAGNTTSWSPSPRDENTLYYWRARACDAEVCSVWMSTASFFVNTMNDVPSVPGISTPPDGALVTTFQPELEVTNAGDPDGDPLTYEFQLYADEAMTVLIASKEGVAQDWDGTTSWQVDVALQNNRTYWWRARARDNENQPGGWSELFSFTITTSNAAPSAPAIITPQEGAEVQTLEPALVIYNSTDPNNDPVTYNFDVDKVNTFNSTALQRSSRLPEGVGGITAWRPPVPLTDGATYYWRVIACDGLSYSDWTTGSFVVNLANDPPTTPEILNPQNEVKTLEPALVIKNSTDPNLDPVTYYFEIDREEDFSGTARQQSPRLSQGVGGMTSWRPSTLADNMAYNWRVIAFDGRSFSDWVNGSFFVNQANDPPDTPTIQSPGQGDEVVALMPVLSVNDAADVDGDTVTYDYEVYADPNGMTLVGSAVGAGTSWQVGTDLDENRHYWWRFRARDDEGLVSPWSGLFTFFVNTVNDAPTAPSVNQPQDGWNVETRVPVLSVNNAWDVDDDTLTYEFEIDRVSAFDSGNPQFGTVPQGMANTTSWSPAELEEHTAYYWRVRACDEDNCSEWMETARFFVNTLNEPPSIPNISAPPDGSCVTTSKPTLEVTNATDPDQEPIAYEFEVYGDQAMNSLITWKTGVLEEEDGTTSWCVCSWLSSKRTYWWRARARDREGAASGWTDLCAFTVDLKNDAPTVPSIVSPEDGGEVGTLEPVIEVNNAQDRNRDTLTYFFEMDKVNTFDGPALQQSAEIPQGAGGATSWAVSELDDNSLYYWRVRAFDGEAYGDWCIGSFFVNLVNDPPSTPTIKNPDQGCVLTVSQPTLSMHPATDPDLDEITYDYELYSDPGLGPDDLVGSAAGAGTAWQVEVTLEDHVTYYWTARAVDEHGAAGEWSPAVSFSVNTRNARPEAPALNNPYNGGIVTGLRPTLSVNNAVDPDHGLLTYEFELYVDRSLTHKVASAGLFQGDLITSWKVGTELTDKAIYYWRARVYDGELRSSWMNTAFFVVDTEAAEMCVVPACAKEVFVSDQSAQIVEVRRRWSLLNGVSVEVPPGALREDCTITIGMVENPPALPPYTKAIGRVIDFGPDGTTFKKPVTVRIPYTLADLFNAGVNDPALLQIWTFNTATMAWEGVPVDHVEGLFLVYYVDHFSMFTTGLSVSSTPSTGAGSTGAESGGGGGCFIATVAGDAFPYAPARLFLFLLFIMVYRRKRRN